MAVTSSPTTHTLSAPSSDPLKTLHHQQQLTLTILLADRLHETTLNSPAFSLLAPLSLALSTALRSPIHHLSSPNLYDPPLRRILSDVTKTLNRSLSLVRRPTLLRHLFSISSPNTDIRKISSLLESSLADLQWLLSLFESDDLASTTTIPPIASNDPILAWVWSSIASIHRDCKDRVDAATSLSSLARGNERFRKVIVEEGGVAPLLKLLKDGGGSPEGRIAAANALYYLADERERTREIAEELGIGVIVHVLRTASMKVQVAVADVVARVSEVDSEAREEFGKENVMKPLVATLMMDLEIDVPTGGRTSIHSIVQKELDAKNHNHSVNGSINGCGSDYRVESCSSFDRKGRENESPEVKHKLKTTCALALWRLCEGSVLNSQKIAEPRGLFCLSKVIENERGELKLNCLLTVMEVAKVAEVSAELRKGAWKPTSPPAKAVLDQLLRVIKEERDPEFRIPAIRAIGCLARIFPSKETVVVESLVKQLLAAKVNVATEAADALAKFACPDNHNCVAHSKTIIEFGGVDPLMVLLRGNDRAKRNGFVLLSYLSMHVANSKALAEVGAMKALQDAVRSGMAPNPELREIFHRAMHHLKLYQVGDKADSRSLNVV